MNLKYTRARRTSAATLLPIMSDVGEENNLPPPLAPFNAYQFGVFPCLAPLQRGLWVEQDSRRPRIGRDPLEAGRTDHVDSG